MESEDTNGDPGAPRDDLTPTAGEKIGESGSK